MATWCARATLFKVLIVNGGWVDRDRHVLPFTGIPDAEQELKERLVVAGRELRKHKPPEMTVGQEMIKGLLRFLHDAGQDGMSIPEMQWHFGQLGVKVSAKEIGTPLFQYSMDRHLRKWESSLKKGVRSRRHAHHFRSTATSRADATHFA